MAAQKRQQKTRNAIRFMRRGTSTPYEFEPVNSNNPGGKLQHFRSKQSEMTIGLESRFGKATKTRAGNIASGNLQGMQPDLTAKRKGSVADNEISLSATEPV